MSRPQTNGRQSTAATSPAQRINPSGEVALSQRRRRNSAARRDSLATLTPEQVDSVDDNRARRQRTRHDDYMWHSMAGPPAPPPNYDQHHAYYSQGYLEANPWMQENEQGDDSPRFTLAGNFPRTVRWGKGKKKNQDDTAPERVPADEKGEREVAPQVVAAEDQGAEVELGEEDHDYIEEAANPREEEAAKERRRLRRQGTQSTTGQRSQLTKADSKTQPQHRPTDQELNPTKPFNYWAVIRSKALYPLGEWLGMTIFIFLGTSANLAVTTTASESMPAGTQLSLYWAWGFAVMIGIYISGGSSGAFFNPVLVIALSLFRGFPWRRVPLYIFIQVLGAFCGTLLSFAVYHDSILHLDGALVPDSTGVAVYTQPRDWVSSSTAFFAEVLGSAVITCAIIALGDSGNSPPGAGMHAFIIGLVTTATSMALSYPTRGCFNPARDLGPRLAALAVGYPTSAFSARHNWWIWGAWAAPILGGLLGASLYDLCVFQGGESPINYSVSRWQYKGMWGKRKICKGLGRKGKREAIDRRLEGGEMRAEEDMR